MSVIHELGISETPYGRYLTALKLRADGEEWIPSMINAAVAGSEDAVGELMPVQNRKDVRKGLASAYLRRNDRFGVPQTQRCRRTCQVLRRGGHVVPRQVLRRRS